MTAILATTLPIFLLIALGFGAARLGAVPPDFISGLGFFVLNFALPALVLNALLGQDFATTFNAGYVAAYAGGSLVVFLGALAFFRMLGRTLSHAAIASLGGVASNSGFVGFPVASLAIGAPALTALPLSMLVENALIIPLALGLAEASRGDARPVTRMVADAGARLVRMPLFLAILVGILLSLAGVSLPAPLDRAIGMVADASAACALFVVGGTLAGVGLASLNTDVAWIVLAKLILHPLAVAAGFVLIGGVPAGLMAAGLILAASPMLTVFPIFGQRFGLGGLAAAALVAATAASFLTLTTVIAMLPTGIAAPPDATPPAETADARLTGVGAGFQIVISAPGGRQ
ncbi:MAG: AEC family transporter [Rhizobiaceae bacterium]|nr:AEC family transporter [Rhizobiaceae bacterium]